MPTTEFDLGLFDTISALIQEQHAATRPNRREGERRPFPCQQLLAPYDGAELPGTDKLRLVQCYDLSPQGFSFQANEKFETDQVIICLGRIPFQFFVAEVVRVKPTYSNSEQLYHFGCRFLRRL